MLFNIVCVTTILVNIAILAVLGAIGVGLYLRTKRSKKLFESRGNK